MLNRDPDRYISVRAVYDKGHIKCLFDIFRFLKKTPFTADIGITLKHFNICMDKVEKFSIEDLIKIARPFGWTLDQVFALWKAQYQLQLEKRSKEVKAIK